MPYPDYSGGASGYYQPDPLVSFPPTPSVAGGDRHPWKINIINDPEFPETAPPKWVLSTTGTLIYDPSRLSRVTKYVNIDDVALGVDISGESVVYLLYTLANSSVTFKIEARAADDQTVWKRYLPEDAFDDKDNIKDLTHSKTPIAIIRNNPDPPDDPTPADQYIVTQLVRSNMEISTVCSNGVPLEVFIPL